MKKIILDGQEVDKLVLESLPMLIHGEHGSGASLYTVCLAAKWFSQGSNILFLCGYPMAEEAFAQEVGIDYSHVRFYTQEKVDDFLGALKDVVHENTIFIVKNIELFDDKVFDAINEIDKLIISGDVYKSKIREKVLSKQFSTEVYFSAFEGKEIPELEEYHGFVIAEDYQGITSLSE